MGSILFKVGKAGIFILLNSAIISRKYQGECLIFKTLFEWAGFPDTASVLRSEMKRHEIYCAESEVISLIRGRRFMNTQG
jgi:hypothetical protein